MTSSSRIEPPGWITAVAPASASTSRPSRNGKKASEATTEPFSDRPALVGLDAGDLGRVDAAHLAGADAQGHAAAAEDDGVGLDELGDAFGEEQVFDLLGGRLHLGDDLEAGGLGGEVVGRLHQQAAADALQFQLVAGRGRAARPARAGSVLAGQRGLGFGGEGRGDQHFDEVLALVHGVDHVEADFAVEGDDAAEGGGRSRS